MWEGRSQTFSHEVDQYSREAKGSSEIFGIESSSTVKIGALVFAY